MTSTDFDGSTYAPARDEKRMTAHLKRVHDLMVDRQWRSLNAIVNATGGSQAGVSARLRDLRKEKFGGFVIERKHISGGLWLYRMAP